MVLELVGQVLDGSPAGDHAELRDVEVGIASVVAGRVADRGLTRMAGGESSTISALGSGGFIQTTLGQVYRDRRSIREHVR